MSEWTFIPPRGGVAPPAGPSYDYGAPAGTGGTTGGGTVVAQWTFQETSGNITDGVNSIVLTKVNGTSFIYEAPVSYEGENITKGININGATGLGGTVGYWQNGSSQSVMDIGTGSAVFEFVCSTQLSGNHFTLDCRDSSASPTRGYSFGLNHGSFMRYNMYGDDGTFRSADMVTVSDKRWGAGQLSKVRIVINRGDNTLKIYINGTLLASSTISTLSGKYISNRGVTLGANRGGTQNCYMTFCELRMTTGTTTANSDGPGGG